MSISILLHTVDYRGDHAADVSEAHELKPGETVLALMYRLLGRSTYVDGTREWIELRLVKEEGK